MRSPRLVALALAGLVTLAASSARADHNFKYSLEMGGGPEWPITPASYRDDYAVGGLMFLRFTYLGDRFTVGATGLFGIMSIDGDTLAAKLKSKAPMGSPDVGGGASQFAALAVNGSIFFLGRTSTGGMYATGAMGFAGAWADKLQFGTKLANGTVVYDSTTKDLPPPEPFTPFQPRMIMMAGIGATTGTPDRAPYLSIAAEVGPTLLVFSGEPVAMMGFTVTFGLFM